MEYQKDIDYIQRILQGDKEAYRFLVEKHKDMAFTIAFKVTRNREDAEEILQDSFLKAYQNLETFKKKAKFSTWLYRITYNTAISKVRKSTPEFTDFDDAITEKYMIEEVQSDIKEQSIQEQTKLINKALEKLNEKDYLIISLFYLKGHSIEDIFDITGISKNNIKVKLHRIRKKLYKEMHHFISDQVICENV